MARLAGCAGKGANSPRQDPASTDRLNAETMLSEEEIEEQGSNQDKVVMGDMASGGEALDENNDGEEDGLIIEPSLAIELEDVGNP